MPAKKLTYEVDVRTSDGVSELRRLGTEGARAGKDIADGFDQAESASKSALSALSAQLDKVESDAKGTAAAVAAIKAHLTVDVDDAKIAQFASDVKNKMGVTFDAIEADAREFAAVLERGVDMSKTTNEIKGVGTALDKTRGEADQSRSVLANMAGNTAQDLGSLGGVVGSLGVGVGQLAEYATEGGISLKGLAGMAGPMAALAVAGAGVASVMKNIAETKKFDADQVKKFSDAFAELGDTSRALSTSLDGVFNARVDNDSLWGQLTGAQKTQDLATNLAKVGVTLGDIDRIIRSGASDRASFELLPDVQNLDAILQGAGLSVSEYEAIMDGVFETTKNWTTATDGAAKSAQFFGSTLSTVNEAIKGQLIEENPFAAFDWGLFQTGGHLVDLQAIWNDVVRDMSDDDASFSTTAANVDVLAAAMHMTREEVIALAREQGDYAKATGDSTAITELFAEQQDAAAAAVQGQVDALQALIDKNQGIIDSTHDLAAAQQEWDDTLAAWPSTIAALNAAIDDADTSEERVDAINAERDAVEANTDQWERAMELRFKNQGVEFTNVDKVNAQAHALASVASTLDDDVIPSLATYYRDIFNIPEDRMTSFEIVLARGDADEIELFIANNSGTKDLAIKVAADQAALDQTQADLDGTATPRTALVTAEASTWDAKGQLNGLKAPLVAPVSADTSQATADMNWWRRIQGTTPVTVPVKTSTSRITKSAAPQAAGVSTMEAAPTATSAASGGDVWAPMSLSVGRPVNINVEVKAAVIGSRADVQRAVLDAMAQAQRLGRIPA